MNREHEKNQTNLCMKNGPINNKIVGTWTQATAHATPRYTLANVRIWRTIQLLGCRKTERDEASDCSKMISFPKWPMTITLTLKTAAAAAARRYYHVWKRTFAATTRLSSGPSMHRASPAPAGRRAMRTDNSAGQLSRHRSSRWRNGLIVHIDQWSNRVDRTAIHT